MDFKTVIITKHPIDMIWAGMRDDLPNLVDMLDDIKEIKVEHYEKGAEICKIVNVWTASPRIPASIDKYLDSDMFVWTDCAEWNEKHMECVWRIEPHFFRGKIECSGSTKFDKAMGGRGTKVTFKGSFKCCRQSVLGVPNFLQEPVYIGVESLLKNLIPKNFRKITDSLTAHLNSKCK